MPLVCTDPVSTASTFNSLPICGSGFWAPFYIITEVREMTRSPLICARSVMRASVIPSAKYSWSGSRDKFVSGGTARD